MPAPTKWGALRGRSASGVAAWTLSPPVFAASAMTAGWKSVGLMVLVIPMRVGRVAMGSNSCLAHAHAPRTPIAQTGIVASRDSAARPIVVIAPGASNRSAARAVEPTKMSVFSSVQATLSCIAASACANDARVTRSVSKTSSVCLTEIETSPEMLGRVPKTSRGRTASDTAWVAPTSPSFFVGQTVHAPPMRSSVSPSAQSGACASEAAVSTRPALAEAVARGGPCVQPSSGPRDSGVGGSASPPVEVVSGLKAWSAYPIFAVERSVSRVTAMFSPKTRSVAVRSGIETRARRSVTVEPA